DGLLAGAFVGSHRLSSEMADGVVHPPAPGGDRVRGHATDFLPIETLPPRIRSCLGLRSTRWTRVRMAMFRVVAPLAFQVCPKRLTYYPESFRAERARGLL
ncbi:MAG: hypothetical protein VYE68_04415, partial [Acidobacteriota bacterium]|nr:hypothetical protein [Acidobacteriota bacterium]